MLDAAKRIERFSRGKSLADYSMTTFCILPSNGNSRSSAKRWRVWSSAPGVAATFTDSRKISGFRHALIHGYDSIDHTISWSIVETKLPVLRRELGAMLDAGAGGGE